MCSTAKLVCPWVQRTCSGKVPPWVPTRMGFWPIVQPGRGKKSARNRASRSSGWYPLRWQSVQSLSPGARIKGRANCWNHSKRLCSMPSLQGLLPPLISPTWMTHSKPSARLISSTSRPKRTLSTGEYGISAIRAKAKGSSADGVWALAAASSATIRDRLRRYRAIHFLQIVGNTPLDVGFRRCKRTKNKSSFGNNVKDRLLHLISKIDHFQGKTAKPWIIS